ncbi:allatostatin-A receptor-like [Diadema antillarum]|uniref:allatostatin-A receptor-like n=1 Tax=Diadema antillarum TaxID=105358 RepID=UPI003A8B5050
MLADLIARSSLLATLCKIIVYMQHGTFPVDATLSSSPETVGHSAFTTDVTDLLFTMDDFGRGKKDVTAWATMETVIVDYETDVILNEEVTEEGSMVIDGFPPSKGTWSWMPIEINLWLSLQLVSAVVGIIGNLLVIVVLFKRRAKNRSTDTLINALAVADFMTSLFLLPWPTALTMPNNVLGWLYCKIIFNHYPLWVCISASVYTLTAISVERYIAIKHPIYFNRIVTKRRVNIVIGCMWIIGLITPLPARFVFTIHPMTYACIILYDKPYKNLMVSLFLGTMRLIIPLLTMLFTQSAIIIELYLQSKKFRRNTKGDAPSFHIVARTRVIKMMMVVIGFFFLFWTPLNMYFILIGFQAVPVSNLIDELMYELFIVLGCYNSCINPIIYTLRGANFRAAVKDLFRSSKEASSVTDRGGLF